MHSIDFSRTATTGKSRAQSASVLFISEKLSLLGAASVMNLATSGQIARAIAASSFQGKPQQALMISGVTGIASDRILLIGIGAEKTINTRRIEEAAGTAVSQLLGAKVMTAELLSDTIKSGSIKPAAIAAHLAYGATLSSYRFDKYRTTQKPEDKPSLAKLTIVTDAQEAARKLFAPLKAVADSVHLTRDLISEPANILYPESLAAECKKLSKLGLKVEVLGEEEMKKLGMGSLLGVGQGSVRESQLVVMQWQGGKKGDKPLALVGKGVCFDTGGISIKPAGGMEDMKWDMAGSAAVIGVMRALASRKAKVNAVGVVGLVENMPDGNAQRPGDVVTSMSGQTIEVLNTDAEGRLVLADAIWYTHTRFNPRCIVDLATLTGAIIITLGSHRAGLFSNNDKLAQQLSSAADATGEAVWRLPIGAEYDEMINCDIADMKNISDGREAGSITAAQFIKRFVNDIPWVHLDIAGVAWSKKATPIAPKGAVGWGVRLLNHWIEQYYEK